MNQSIPHRIIGLRLGQLAWLFFAGAATCMVVYTLSDNFIGWWNSNLTENPDLAAIGLPAQFWAIYFTLGASVEMLSWVLVGWLIFWRKSRDRFTLGFSLMLVLVGALHIDGVTDIIISKSLPALKPLLALLLPLGAALLALWFCFPNGRFVPGWSRWTAVLWAAIQFSSFVFPRTVLDIGTWPQPLPMVITNGFLLLMFGLLIYRYRAVSGPIERQQIKWVATFGLLAGMVYAFGDFFFTWVPLGEAEFFAGHIYRLISYVTYALFAISLGVAILRYRLWDIDVIIRRTLVYGALTGALLMLYFSLVVGLQAIFQALTGQQQSPAATVLSTLAIAALFNPLRTRIQAGIDRRYYRKKYDAQKTVAAFAATLRDEVDLEQLETQLIAVVRDAMQPQEVSLWLNPSGLAKTSNPPYA